MALFYSIKRNDSSDKIILCNVRPRITYKLKLKYVADKIYNSKWKHATRKLRNMSIHIVVLSLLPSSQSISFDLDIFVADGSYTLGVGNKTFLKSSDIFFRADKTIYSLKDGSLKFTSRQFSSGSDKHGNYDVVTNYYLAGNAIVSTSFILYQDYDVIVFEQVNCARISQQWTNIHISNILILPVYLLYLTYTHCRRIIMELKARKRIYLTRQYPDFPVLRSIATILHWAICRMMGLWLEIRWSTLEGMPPLLRNCKLSSSET